VNRLIRITASVAATLALTAPAAAQISTPAPSPWSVVKMVFGTGDGTLGTAVAMTETVVALGESGASSAAGQVRIVRKKAVDDSWVEAEILTPGDAAPGDRFGAAVALAGDLLLVSAPDKGDGAVYVYESDGSVFTYVTTLTGDADGAGFGDHLAFDGDTLAVSSPRVVVDGKKGRVYVFARQGATPWERVAKLSGSEASSTGAYGASVAVGLSFVAVGDPADPNLSNVSGVGDPGDLPGGPDAGVVYVYERDQGSPGQWGELVRTAPFGSHADQRFGSALAMSSGQLAVGAPGDDAGADGGGAVYVYYVSPGGLSSPSRVDPLDPRDDSDFGQGLALRDGRLMVSSKTGDVLAGGFGPAVYVYDRPLQDFEETSRIFVTSALPDGWGKAVAFVGDEAVLGAPGLPEGASIFRRSTDPCDPNPCENDGTCVVDNGEATCDCRFVSYWGERCENPVRCGSCIDTAEPPDDPGYGGQPHLFALGLDAVRSRGTGDGVRVAIVGYGADYTHVDGPGKVRFDLGWDFVDDDADPTDHQGPGTAVLGVLAAATDNGVGLASLAPDAEIIPVRVIDGVTLTTTPERVAAGIDHVRDQAEIILVGVGGLEDDPTLRAAIAAAIDADRVVIAPAGGYPGSYVRVTAVGALNAAGDGADTYGGAYAPPYDLLAPDAGLITLAPSDGYATLPGGEGLAPALVAATAAVVWSISEFPSAASTRDEVEKTAGDLGVSGFDQATGHGALRADVAVSFRLGCANCIAGTDPCVTDPCQNGGICTRVNDTQYECGCPEGWSGPLCNFTAGTPCETNICANGGTCNDHGSFVTCDCKQGYYGPTCAEADCIPNPCDNDGVCTNATQGTHFCLCQPGFNGTDCVNNVDDPCDPDPCVHGTCTGDTESGASCACDGGWTGADCATDVDECATDNGGCEATCENTPGGYACGCPTGFLPLPDGSCQDIDECAMVNGGCAQICTNQDGGFTCSCQTGYALDEDGLGCSDIADCPVDACDNGGTCVDGVGSYSCDCDEDFKGDACELAVGCGDCDVEPTYPSDPKTLAGWAMMRVGAPWAWSKTTGAPTVRVAIVSTGIDGAHPDAPSHFLRELSFDLVEGKSLKDVSGFGTYVAGLLAAPHDGEGIAGVAPNVEVTVLKAAGPNGSATSFLLAEGITTAVVTGAQIILVPAIAQEDFPVVRDAVADALSAGRLVIAPAGGYPGVYDGVLSVAGIDEAGQIHAAFSTPDLLAPDGGVVSTWPGGGYDTVPAGAPTAIVGGVAALVWSTLPGADAAKVRDTLLATAEDIGPPAWDTFSGYGVVRADTAVGLASGCGACAPPKDPCAPNPCDNGGTCERTGQESFTCACPLGFSGEACDEQSDPCVPNPCLNGGTCDFDGHAQRCECPDDFGGEKCQYALGACSEPSSAPGCDDPAVEACVCDLAPQCCTVKWGGVCAQLAVGQCADVAVSPSEDPATRACVCAQAPECCDTWKPICDELAHERCDGRGDCSAAHREPGCADPLVEACVCDQQPLCCSYTWDTACAKIAVRSCGDPEAPDVGYAIQHVTPCDDIHSGTGCSDDVVESCVCASLPHCCSVRWDVACAKQAVNYCAPPEEDPEPPAEEDPPSPTTPPAEDPPSYEGPDKTLGPCCQANVSTTGCNEPVTESCVCELLPECCEAGWDERCALIATEVCEAFCDPDAPAPQEPPNPGVPGPIDFPEIPSDDPCFGAVVSLTADTCLSVDFQNDVEVARRSYEEFGIVTPCIEEKASRCGELMTAELDARFATELDLAPARPDLVIKPFEVPEDFLPSRVTAVADPTDPGPTQPSPTPSQAPFVDPYPVFAASPDVNSCEEYAFQVVWDYQQWRRYENSLFSRAYSLPLTGGGIGRRGLRVENNSPTVRRAVRTLTEAFTNETSIQDWSRPRLGREFAAPKNGFFTLNSASLQEAVARLGTQYALLALVSQAGGDYYEERAIRPWHWHRETGDRLTLQDGWTLTDLAELDAIEREFSALVREWGRTSGRIGLSSTTPAERAALEARREALTRQIAEGLEFAADLGCMDLSEPGPCDWAVGDFLEEVESLYSWQYKHEYERCLDLTGNNFDNLTWLTPNPSQTALDVVDADPRDSDLTFVLFMLDLERSIRTVAGNVGEDLNLAGGDVDETEFGNSYFGVRFGWDNRYRMDKPALNLVNGVCEFSAEAGSDFHVVGQLLGDDYDIFRAEASADVIARIGYGRVVVRDEVIYTGGDEDGGTADTIPLNIVLEPTREQTSVRKDYVDYDEWITAFWVPVHLYAGITGQLGADIAVRAKRTGFHRAITDEMVCHDDFEMEARTAVSPFAGLYAKASAGIGIPGFEVGIGGRLTLVEGSLPFTAELKAGQRANGSQTGLANVVVTTQARGSATLTAFKGELYVYLDYPCNWGLDTCTAKRRLANAKGWTRSTPLFSPSSGIYDVGQVAQLCAAVAVIPNDVLDCEGAQ